MSEEKVAEYKAEIDRLKLLLAAAEKKREVRSCRVELYPDGERLGIIITAPNTIDEIEFGRYVAAQMAMILLNVAGVSAVKTGNVEQTPQG